MWLSTIDKRDNIFYSFLFGLLVAIFNKKCYDNTMEELIWMQKIV